MRAPALVAALVLALAAAPALPGCGITDLIPRNPDRQVPEGAEWQETGALDVPSLAILWNDVRDVLESQGFAVDETRSDFATRTLVTRWNVYVATTSYQGRRMRAHAELLDAGDGRWNVRVSVLRQRNADIDDPTDPLQAEWEADGVETSRAALIVWKVRTSFEPDGAEGAEPGPAPK